MGLFDKNYDEEILKSFDVDEFISSINKYDYAPWVHSELQLFSTKYFGIDLKVIWPTLDQYEKLEFIFFLNRIADQQNYTYRNYMNFKENDKFKHFWNKVENFVLASPQQLKEVKTKFGQQVQFFDTEISEVLDIIQDETLNSHVNKFLKSSNGKEMEKHLYAIQKPHYSEIRKYKKMEFDPFNPDNLKRRIEVFIRHDKEANDKQLKTYYDNLNDAEKLKELKILLLDLLCFISRQKVLND